MWIFYPIIICFILSLVQGKGYHCPDHEVVRPLTNVSQEFCETNPLMDYLAKGLRANNCLDNLVGKHVKNCTEIIDCHADMIYSGYMDGLSKTDFIQVQLARIADTHHFDKDSCFLYDRHWQAVYASNHTITTSEHGPLVREYREYDMITRFYNSFNSCATSMKLWVQSQLFV